MKLSRGSNKALVILGLAAFVAATVSAQAARRGAGTPPPVVIFTPKPVTSNP